MPDRSWGRGKYLCFLTEIWCHSMTAPGTGVIRLGTVLHSPSASAWVRRGKMTPCGHRPVTVVTRAP